MTVFQPNPPPDKQPNVAGGDNFIVKQVAVASGALPRLDDSKPVYVAVGSDFQGVTARALGNAVTGTDGFDSIVATPLGAFNGDVAALPQLDQHIADAEFGDGQFGSGNIDPIVADAGPLVTAGDGIIDGPTVAPPNQPPSPPPTGGSSSGGSGSGGGSGGIDGGGGSSGGGGAGECDPSQRDPSRADVCN